MTGSFITAMQVNHINNQEDWINMRKTDDRPLSNIAKDLLWKRGITI